MLPAAINKKSSKKNPNRLISIVHSSSVFVHTALSVSPRKYTCTHARRAYKYTGAMSVYLYTRVPVAWLLLLALTRITEKTTTFCFFSMIHSLSWWWRFSSSARKNRTCLPMIRLLYRFNNYVFCAAKITNFWKCTIQDCIFNVM